MKAFLFNLIARLVPWLHRALSEDNGNPSSMRLFVLLWHVPAVLLWTALSIVHHALEPIPESVGVVLLGMTGIKTAQKFGEAKAPPDMP